MDQMQLLTWSQAIASQRERSHAAYAQHVRTEQGRQARGAEPKAVSVLARAWPVAWRTRASVEPDSLATQA